MSETGDRVERGGEAAIDVAGRRWRLWFVSGWVKADGRDYKVVYDWDRLEIRVSRLCTAEQAARIVAGVVALLWREAAGREQARGGPERPAARGRRPLRRRRSRWWRDGAAACRRK